MIQWATEQLKTTQPRPFLMVAGIYRPHLPFYAPKEYFQLFNSEALETPAVLKDDIKDLPPAGRSMASQRREDLELVKTEGKFRELIHAYLASITFTDALIGRLLDALESGPSADNTIVVLWSDHGWHFGEKEHLHKMTLWERATRVPFIISLPHNRNRSSICTAPVGLIDIFPTLNSLVSNGPSLPGSDVAALQRFPFLSKTRSAIFLLSDIGSNKEKLYDLTTVTSSSCTL